MSIIDWLNPFKKAWWREEQWHKVQDSQNAYEVVEKRGCPSWELEFYFCQKYRNKDTCEVRWRKRNRERMLDKTVFEHPEEVMQKMNKSRSRPGHNKLIGEDIELYEGPKYE